MDREKLAELLNGDLELEFRSIVQYTQHAATVVDRFHSHDDRVARTP